VIIEWFYTPLGGVQRRGGWCGEKGVDARTGAVSTPANYFKRSSYFATGSFNEATGEKTYFIRDSACPPPPHRPAPLNRPCESVMVIYLRVSNYSSATVAAPAENPILCLVDRCRRRCSRKVYAYIPIFRVRKCYYMSVYICVWCVCMWLGIQIVGRRTNGRSIDLYLDSQAAGTRS